MARFEYKIEAVNWAHRHATLEAVMNARAAEGWRVMDLQTRDGIHDWSTVIFEREVPPPVTLEREVEVGKMPSQERVEDVDPSNPDPP